MKIHYNSEEVRIVNLYNTYGIYGIRNKLNGKVYVGKTQMNFGDRRDCHFATLRGGYHINPHLQKAWDKYGEENFEFVVLRDCTDWCSADELNKLEQVYIKQYMDAGLAYNIGVGGDGGTNLGRHLSDATKKKIGEANRINMLGKKASDETKQKMSETQKKRYAEMSEERRAEIAAKSAECARGYHWSEESKQRMSEIQKTKPNGAKYDIDTVHEIRRLHEEEGMSYREISELFGIARHTVYLIATYRRWKDA